jgi:hypothetical protein
MLIGFVPYGEGHGLFTMAYQPDEAAPPGKGASIQFRLNSEVWLSRVRSGILLSHPGQFTRGRGRIARAELAELATDVEPRAAAALGMSAPMRWPFAIGSTANLAALLDRLFLFTFVVEQAKRQFVLRHQPDGLNPTPLLRSLEDAVETEAEAAEVVEARGLARGQGSGLTLEERRAVESYAVQRAVEYFRKLGYSRIREKGRPYDLQCEGRRGTIRVEVKGTTGRGDEVVVTRGEVEHARAFARTVLFVVSGIELTRQGRPRGGRARVWDPWKIDKDSLRPRAFDHIVDRRRGRSV